MYAKVDIVEANCSSYKTQSIFFPRKNQEQHYS